MRILLVENHADTATATGRLLTRHGHAVRTASTAGEAVALCEREPFDLLITDIGLPDSDGWELVQKLRGKCVPRAIALTGYGMAADLEKSRVAGFDAHLTKPVQMTTLLEAVSRLAVD
jgi:CheY-like chemotaxis protein